MIFYTGEVNRHWAGKSSQVKELAQTGIYVFVVKTTDVFGKNCNIPSTAPPAITLFRS